MIDRHLTFRQYRSLDLFFFAGILLISELLIVNAAGRWFPDQLYTVSVSAAVTAIVLMRWGLWAALHAFWGGAVFCFAAGGSLRQFAVYCLGNEAALLSLFLIHRFGKDRIRTDKLLTLLFALCTQLFMQGGRALIALLSGASPDICLSFFTADALSDVFTMVVLWIASRLDGILEDQKSYLLRLHRQMELEKGGYE